MGRPMTEVEKKALNNALRGPQGFMTGYRVDSHESYEQGLEAAKLYYGAKPEADTEEKIRVSIDEIIPNVMENRPVGYPETASLAMFQKFRIRTIPTFLGMLAEVSLNNNITLDELVDTTSPRAKEAKKRAMEVLREKLPKKDENGKWVFDYEGFLEFFHNNSIRIQFKLYEVLKDLPNKSIYEQYKICNKYENIVMGLFDGYNQHFLSDSFIPVDYKDREIFKRANVTNQALCTYMMIVNATTRAINAADLEEGVAKDIGVYTAHLFRTNLGPFYQLTQKAIETDATHDELLAEYARIQSIKPAWYESFYAIGMLRQLTDFERNVLAMDEELNGKILVKYKPQDPESNSTGNDLEVYYVDNDGNELPLQHKDDPEKYDMSTLAKMRYEINQVILKPRYSDFLIENGYSMDEINYFQGLEPIQRVAYMQCEDTINNLTDLYKQMSKSIRDRLDAGDRVNPEYVALMNKTMDTIQKFENLVANPNPNNMEVISTAVEELQNACDAYQVSVENRPNEPEAHLDLSRKINKAAADYAVIKDRIVESVKSNRVQEVRNAEQFTAFEKVLLKAGEGIEWPEGMSEDEYMAIVVGAFLSDDVIRQANLANGDLAEEKAWNTMLNDILGGTASNDANVTNAINTARLNANRAIQAYVAGNKTAANAYIKDFIRVSERLYDKNRVFEKNAGNNTIASEMLSLSANLVSKDEYKTFTNLENTIRNRQAIDAGVMSIVKAGDVASVKVLEGNITMADRKEAVLDILTKVYLNARAQEENVPKNISPSARLRAALAQRGIKLEPEVNNDANLAEMSDTVNHYYDLSRISDLEANFIGTNADGKSAKDEFVEHIRAELENTPVYKLLMENNTALEDVAIYGVSSDILNGNNMASLKNIKYLRTHKDIDNTMGTEEYNNQMDGVIASISDKVNYKNELVKLTKEEIAGRGPIDYGKSIFAQYAGHMSEVLSAHRDSLVASGGSAEKIDELITKLKEHHEQMNVIYSKQVEPGLVDNHAALTARFNDIERLYKDIFDVDFEVFDSPLDLMQVEKALIDKCVPIRIQELNATRAGQNIRDEDRFNFKNEMKIAINEYNGDKLVRAYSDVVSKEYLRDTTYPAVIELIDRLDSAKKDGEFKEEYKTVVKGAQYLKAIVKKMTAADKPDTLTAEDFEVYKDAVDALEQKVNAYEQKAVLSTSARRIAVDDVKAYLNRVVPRVNEASEVYNAQAEDTKRKEIAKLQSNIPNAMRKLLESQIEKSIAFEVTDARAHDNFYKMFGERLFTDGDTWVANFARDYLNSENDYNVDESFGYSKEDFAIIAGVIAFSETLRKMTADEIMNACGTTYTDIFIERTKATGEARLAEYVNSARLKMNELIGEMKQGNYDNVGKLFKEGLRIILANGVGVNDYGITSIGNSQQHRMLKDVADFLDRHQNFKEIATSHQEDVKDIEPYNFENMKNFQKFGPVMDEFAAAYGRVGRYLQENLDNGTVTLAADSDIARDVEYVMAYLRLCDTATDERNKGLADAQAQRDAISKVNMEKYNESYSQINTTKARINAIVEHNVEKLKKYNLLDVPEKELAEIKTQLEKKLVEYEAQFEEAKAAMSLDEMSLSLHYDMTPKCVANMGPEEFKAKIEAEKARLFDGKETKQLSINELAGMTVNIKHELTHSAIKSTIVAEPTEFHKSSVVKFYNNSIDVLRAMQTTAQDGQISKKIGAFADKLEYVATRLKKLETPLKDGSYINFPKELEDSITKLYDDLKTLAGDIVKDKNKADLYVKENTYSAFTEFIKHFNNAVDKDVAALREGKLYGVTEIHNMKKQLDAIDRIGNVLTLSKSFGDGSSPEFKAMLNDLASLKQESAQTKRTDGGVATYVGKLEKLRESAKEYLRHKQISNNGRSTSLNRIAKTKELIECLDGIMPNVKAEAKANSYVSRFEKMDYSKDKIADRDAIFAKLDDKRNELELLKDGVYKDVSVMGLAARERLVELVLKGDIDSDDANTREEVKQCVATIILEKRIQYERMAKLNQFGLASPFRNMGSDFTDKFSAARKAEKAKPIQPQQPAVADNADVVENINDINTNLSIDALIAERHEPPKNIYEKTVDQIKNYNFISDDDLQQDKIIELLTDENKEVETLYLKGLNNAIERANKAQMEPKRNVVNQAEADEANVGAMANGLGKK